jgi:site-specific recombinase XerD
MNEIEMLVKYRRFLKRRNYSTHTIKDYMNTLQHFLGWLERPIEEVTPKEISAYIDSLLAKGLAAKTINCRLDSVRGFYRYMSHEEGMSLPNPVKKGYALRLARPLPRYLKDEEVLRLFEVITDLRDRAIFTLMLRCGLRVEEVAHLTLQDLELDQRRILVCRGKGNKGRVVYISHDAYRALHDYLRSRSSLRVKAAFLVGKGAYRGTPISVRGIQKRIEYYAREAELNISCHHLRHTMATQLLNADADLVTIQDLLGHTRIKTTQRYARVSNLKVQRDYYKAMEVILRKSAQENIGVHSFNRFGEQQANFVQSGGY